MVDFILEVSFKKNILNSKKFKDDIEFAFSVVQ